jgi:hypothetical protein
MKLQLFKHSENLDLPVSCDSCIILWEGRTILPSFMQSTVTSVNTDDVVIYEPE